MHCSMWRYMQMQLKELCQSMPMQPHRVGAVLLHVKQPVLMLQQYAKEAGCKGDCEQIVWHVTLSKCPQLEHMLCFSDHAALNDVHDRQYVLIMLHTAVPCLSHPDFILHAKPLCTQEQHNSACLQIIMELFTVTNNHLLCRHTIRPGGSARCQPFRLANTPTPVCLLQASLCRQQRPSTSAGHCRRHSLCHG